MKLLAALAVFSVLMTGAQAMPKPGAHTQGTPTGKPSGTLKPGEYWWNPQLSPAGPVVILVSIPQQVLHVYRNGILIGRSSVSTGSPGHSTPGGIFTILEKRTDHYSKTYGNAPMPNMQRLTWDGIALHSGNIPGHPASHGCVRLPYDFSQLLFSVTNRGGTVIIGDGKTPVPRLASNPGLLLAPEDLTPEMLRPLANGEYDWEPGRSKTGPVTIVVSSADRAIYVYRNGNPIGRAALQLEGTGPLANQVFTLLDGTTERQSRFVPGRKARRWMTVAASGRPVDPDDIAERLRFNPEFGEKVYDLISPGTTVIVTDQPVVRKKNNAGVFES